MIHQPYVPVTSDVQLFMMPHQENSELFGFVIELTSKSEDTRSGFKVAEFVFTVQGESLLPFPSGKDFLDHLLPAYLH